MNVAHCDPPLTEDADFDHWFERSWKQKDRPFPDVLPTPAGYDRRTLRQLGLRL